MLYPSPRPSSTLIARIRTTDMVTIMSLLLGEVETLRR
jgi:hypothetical protein